MAYPEPKPGLVICYSYLWHDEKKKGQEEGLKDRPCVIANVLFKEGKWIVEVAPITHTQPQKHSYPIEIPPRTKQRLGLDDAPSWVVTNEINRFEWPGFDLRPISRNRPSDIVYGFLPHDTIKRIRDHVRVHARQGAISRDLEQTNGNNHENEPER